MTLIFTIYGKPQPAGSKRGFAYRGKDGKQHVAISDANKNSRPWKDSVIAAAREAHRGGQVLGPVQLEVTFYIPRPRSHYGTGRNASVLKASSPGWPTSKPDLLKLARGVEDAITEAGVWRDDAQIAVEKLEKRWSMDGGYKTDVEIAWRDEEAT
jgi:Holliday junction resolvase RusA-like endonuclease